MPARPWHWHCRRWRGGWTRPRPHASTATPPGHSPRSSTVKRRNMGAMTFGKTALSRWRAGWTRPSPHELRARRRTLAEALAVKRMYLAAISWQRRCRRWRPDGPDRVRTHLRARRRTLVEALDRETDATSRSPWETRVSVVGPDGPDRGRQDPLRSSRPCDGDRCPRGHGRQRCRRRRRMDPNEAARICGRPPGRSSKHSTVRRMPMAALLGKRTVSVAVRMDLTDAARICGTPPDPRRCSRP